MSIPEPCTEPSKASNAAALQWLLMQILTLQLQIKPRQLRASSGKPVLRLPYLTQLHSGFVEVPVRVMDGEPISI